MEKIFLPPWLPWCVLILIMMVCPNLPYEQQHLIENTYFAGITPPPKEPTMTSIMELSDPIVDQLCTWYVLRFHFPMLTITGQTLLFPYEPLMSQ